MTVQSPPREADGASTRHAEAGSFATGQDFADNIPKHISVMSRFVTGHVARQLAPLGLGVGQYPYLFALYDRDGRSQQELSDDLLVDKSSTASAVEKLESAGLIVRSVDPADRRRRVVSLTEAGLRLRPELAESLESASEALLGDLEPAERAIFHDLIRRVAMRALIAEESEIHAKTTTNSLKGETS